MKRVLMIALAVAALGMTANAEARGNRAARPAAQPSLRERVVFVVSAPIRWFHWLEGAARFADGHTLPPGAPVTSPTGR
jgi:hypothetical protein